MLTILFLCLLMVILACTIAYLVILFVSSTIVYSRVAFSLLMALVTSQSDLKLVENSGFLNFVAWTFIFLGIIYLLANLPRVDQAMRFFCTIFMSVMVIYIVAMIFGSIIAAIMGSEFRINALYEILIKIVCLLFALGAMLSDERSAEYNSPKNVILCHAERLLASTMYGFSATFLCWSIADNWYYSGVISVLVIIVGTVGAFFADIYLRDKDILGLKKEKEVEMPK